MRGKADPVAEQAAQYGITPAYAGKREWNELSCIKRGDHPRVCGEKRMDLSSGAGFAGSPPRMRGKVPFSIFHRFGAGITPAYAGKG